MKPSPESQTAAGPCLCDSLRKTTRAVTQFYNQVLQTSGCRVTQANILGLARQSGPLTLSKMAEELVMDRTTLTRNLSLLEKEGMIHIDVGDDRRERWIRITRDGEKTLDRMHQAWVRVQEDILQKLGRERARRLFDDLEAVLDVVKGS